MKGANVFDELRQLVALQLPPPHGAEEGRKCGKHSFIGSHVGNLITNDSGDKVSGNLTLATAIASVFPSETQVNSGQQRRNRTLIPIHQVPR